MMKTIIESNVLLYAMAAMGVLGILVQLFLNRCHRLLLRETSDIQTEKREFLKKLKLKYQTDRKRSGEQVNIPVFIRRNLMDYQCLKLGLHQWQRLAAGLFLASLALGAVGIVYGNTGGIEPVHIREIWQMGAVVTLVSAGFALWLEPWYKMKNIRTRLEDYFCHSGAAAEYAPVDLEEPALKPVKSPAVIGIRKKQEARTETKAQKEKRSLQENLAKAGLGGRETAAAEPEQNRERNRELLRQMDAGEQERIIREVLAEFLA